MTAFNPIRVTRSYSMTVDAPPAAVFPLLCPVRETEWVNDWRPKLVLSNSGFAEPVCVFITPAIPEDALLLMTEYDPAWPVRFEEEARRLQEQFGPEVVGRIEHFGSTAVPGLAAKPIVDMLVEVTSLDGRPISTASVGEQFLIHATVNDTRDAPEGVYTFRVIATTFAGEKIERAGTITLIR